MAFPCRDSYHCEECFAAALKAPPIPMRLAADEQRRDAWRKSAGTSGRRAWVTS